MKSLAALHSNDRPLSAKVLYQTQEGKLTSIQLAKGASLDKHITKIPALLLCVIGETVYEEETGYKKTLKPGDLQEIKENVVHWLKANEDSQLVLTK